jgi:hypothetical protein
MALLRCRCGSIDFDNGVCLRCGLRIEKESVIPTEKKVEAHEEAPVTEISEAGFSKDPFQRKRGGEICGCLCLEAEYSSRMTREQRANRRFLITLRLKNNSTCVLDEVRLCMDSPDVDFTVVGSFVSRRELIWRDLLPFRSHERQDVDRDAYVTWKTHDDVLAMLNVLVKVGEKRYNLYGRLRFYVEEESLLGEQSINIVSAGENIVGDLSFQSGVRANQRSKVRLEIPLRLGTERNSELSITDPIFCGKSFDLTIDGPGGNKINCRIHNKPSVTLGRSRSRDWLTALLPYDSKDPNDPTNQLSRHHLAILARKGKIFVRQLRDPEKGSFPTNGSMVNGRPILEEDERDVFHGDVVNLGGVYPLQIVIPQATSERSQWPDSVLIQCGVKNARAPSTHVLLFHSLSIGFGPECLVRLPKEDAGEAHLVLKPTADGVSASLFSQMENRSSWGSRFPTVPDHKQSLVSGSEIVCGKCKILWREAKIKKGKE